MVRWVHNLCFRVLQFGLFCYSLGTSRTSLPLSGLPNFVLYVMTRFGVTGRSQHDRMTTATRSQNCSKTLFIFN